MVGNFLKVHPNLSLSRVGVFEATLLQLPFVGTPTSHLVGFAIPSENGISPWPAFWTTVDQSNG